MRGLSERRGMSYNAGMETILKSLEQIGVDPATIDAIRASGDVERALILLMDDDRHEYLD